MGWCSPRYRVILVERKNHGWGLASCQAWIAQSATGCIGPWRAPLQMLAYAMAKSAIHGLMRNVARATRRAAEEGGSDVEATGESLLARDEIDSGRAVSPLVMAQGAVHIDTTAYSLDEVVDQVVALVELVGSDA